MTGSQPLVCQIVNGTFYAWMMFLFTRLAYTHRAWLRGACRTMMRPLVARVESWRGRCGESPQG